MLLDMAKKLESLAVGAPAATRGIPGRDTVVTTYTSELTARLARVLGL